MPHMARKKSASGYYHVVPKGQGDQIIFDSDLDRQKYIRLLAEAKADTDIRIHAYCLMSNHVHLILEDRDNSMSEALKYVHERFGAYFADKTGRKGGIIHNPFWSEPIEAEPYLLCAIRYVHGNPAAAGICPASAYRWSSVRDYLGRNKNGITDTEMVLELLGGITGFIQFSQPQNLTLLPFAGSKLKRHVSDEEAKRVAKLVVGENVEHLKICDASIRTEAVRTLGERGFSVQQIARISGLGRKEITRVLNGQQRGNPLVNQGVTP